MNKKDIALERKARASELREWSDRLYEASPALATFFLEQAQFIETPARHYDAYGATVMMGKVKGMVAVAEVLLDEWRRHQ